MVVDLNTQAFYKAQNGDIFVIECIGNKKHAAPISKEKLFECEIERLKSLEVENENLKKEIQNLKQENQKTKEYVESKINSFISIFKGDK